jgi:hypothetical protein
MVNPVREAITCHREGVIGDAATAAAVRRGVDLYHRGLAWQAHEVWEDAWRGAPRDSPDRAVLRALIQAAAAVVQAQRGRWRGVATLARRARPHLPVPFAIAFEAWAAQVVAARAYRPPPAIALDESG